MPQGLNTPNPEEIAEAGATESVAASEAADAPQKMVEVDPVWYFQRKREQQEQIRLAIESGRALSRNIGIVKALDMERTRRELGKGVLRGALNLSTTQMRLYSQGEALVAGMMADLTGLEDVRNVRSPMARFYNAGLKAIEKLTQSPEYLGPDPMPPQFPWAADPGYWSGVGGEGVVYLLGLLVPAGAAGSAARLAGAAPRVVRSIQAAATMLTSASLESGLAYRDWADALEERGLTRAEAESIAARGAAAYGIVAGALDTIPIDRFLERGVPRSAVLRVLTAMAAESVTEELQEEAAIGFEKGIGIYEPESGLQRRLTAAIAGLGIAGPVASVTTRSRVVAEEREEAARAQVRGVMAGISPDARQEMRGVAEEVRGDKNATVNEVATAEVVLEEIDELAGVPQGRLVDPETLAPGQRVSGPEGPGTVASVMRIREGFLGKRRVASTATVRLDDGRVVSVAVNRLVEGPPAREGTPQAAEPKSAEAPSAAPAERVEPAPVSEQPAGPTRPEGPEIAPEPGEIQDVSRETLPEAVAIRIGQEIPANVIERLLERKQITEREARQANAPDDLHIDGKPIQTGQGFTTRTFRGFGRSEGETILAEGAEGAALGPGRYSALSQFEAESFGPQVEPVAVRLSNPIVIRDSQQLSELAGGAPIPESNEQRVPFLRRVRESIEAAGHDGAVIVIERNRDASSVTGRSFKRLREIYDISQIVEFRPEAAQESISAPGSAQPEQGLGPGPAPGRPGRAPAGPVGAGGPVGRPGIVVAGGERLPAPGAFVAADAYQAGLDEQQLLAVNLAISRFSEAGGAVGDVTPGRGFMLADGTGVGKTRQILAIADQYATRGRPVTIITQNKQIIAGSFTADARAMGIDLGQFEVGTYDDLRTGKIGQKENGLVIFDEAHNLKNLESQKTEAATRLIERSEHVLFATATPLDRATGATYFLHHVTGIPEEEIRRRLGFEIVTEMRGRREVRIAQLTEGNTWATVLDNIIDMRNEAVADGAMIRREFPFYGEIVEQDFTLSGPQRNAEDVIDGYWQNRIGAAVSTKTRRNLAGQRIMELGRWTEAQKIEAAKKAITAELEAGRSVIVVAEYINPSEIKGWGRGRSVPGTISELAAWLDQQGIEHARIYGTGDKGAQVERFQSGEVTVALATPKSGGAGINLDDVVGDRPRTMLILTPNFSGDVFDQILGRISRRNTASPAKIVFLRGENLSDNRRGQILQRKMEALRRIQAGQDVDVAAGLEPEPGGEGGVAPGAGRDVGAPQPPRGPPIAAPAALPPVTIPENVQELQALVRTRDAQVVVDPMSAYGLFYIQHPEGRATAYFANRDMPGKAPVATQGELFLVEREPDAARGLGVRLAEDAIRVMARAGARRVIMRVPGTPEGRELIGRLMDGNMIGEATDTNEQTGTSLHEILAESPSGLGPLESELLKVMAPRGEAASEPSAAALPEPTLDEQLREGEPRVITQKELAAGVFASEMLEMEDYIGQVEDRLVSLGFEGGEGMPGLENPESMIVEPDDAAIADMPPLVKARLPIPIMEGAGTLIEVIGQELYDKALQQAVDIAYGRLPPRGLSGVGTRAQPTLRHAETIAGRVLENPDNYEPDVVWQSVVTQLYATAREDFEAEVTEIASQNEELAAMRREADQRRIAKGNKRISAADRRAIREAETALKREARKALRGRAVHTHAPKSIIPASRLEAGMTFRLFDHPFSITSDEQGSLFITGEGLGNAAVPVEHVGAVAMDAGSLETGGTVILSNVIETEGVFGMGRISSELIEEETPGEVTDLLGEAATERGAGGAQQDLGFTGESALQREERLGAEKRVQEMAADDTTPFDWADDVRIWREGTVTPPGFSRVNLLGRSYLVREGLENTEPGTPADAEAQKRAIMAFERKYRGRPGTRDDPTGGTRRAFADFGVLGETLGEIAAGAGRAARRGAGVVGEAALTVAEHWIIDMIDLVSRSGRQSATRAAALARSAVNDTKAVFGELTKQLKHFTEITGGRTRQHRRALSRMQEVQRNEAGTWGIARSLDLVEGRLEPENAAEAEIVDAYRKLIDKGGQIARDRGHLQFVNGEWVPFRYVPGGRVYPRLMHVEFIAVLAQGPTNVWRSVLDAIVEANEPFVDEMGITLTEKEEEAGLTKVQKLRQMVEEEMYALRKSIVGMNEPSAYHRINSEFARITPRMPTHVYTGRGQIQILETHPWTYGRRYADVFSHRAGYISAFGQATGGYRVLDDAGGTIAHKSSKQDANRLAAGLSHPEKRLRKRKPKSLAAIANLLGDADADETMSTDELIGRIMAARAASPMAVSAETEITVEAVPDVLAELMKGMAREPDGKPSHLVALTRVLNGLWADAPWAEAGTPWYLLRRQANNILTLVRSGLLTMASVPNLVEPLGNIQTFNAWSEVLKGAAMVFPGSGARAATIYALERIGAITPDLINVAYNPNRPFESYVRVLSETLNRMFGRKFLEEGQEQLGAIVALIRVGRMAKGESSRVRVAKDAFDLVAMMRWDWETAKRVAGGGGSQEEYLAIVRRAPAFLTAGAIRGAEKTRVSHKPLYRFMIAFELYAQIKVRSLYNMFQALNVAHEARDSAAYIAAVERMAKYFGGAAVAGSLAKFLIAMLTGGLFGLQIAWEEAKDEPLEFIVESILYQLFAGPYAGVIRTMAPSGGAWSDKMARSTLPGFVIDELLHALWGSGQYRDMVLMERMWQMLLRVVPVNRAFRTTAALFGFRKQELEYETARDAYWRWRFDENIRPPSGDFSRGAITEAEQRFHRHMRKAYQALMRGDDETVDLQIGYALKQEAEDPEDFMADDERIRRALLGRRLLTQVSEKQRDALRDRIGDRAYEVLEAHDGLLTEWAAGHGTSGRSLID